MGCEPWAQAPTAHEPANVKLFPTMLHGYMEVLRMRPSYARSRVALAWRGMNARETNVGRGTTTLTAR